MDSRKICPDCLAHLLAAAPELQTSDQDTAHEILRDYAAKDSTIDSGNLFWAAIEFRDKMRELSAQVAAERSRADELACQLAGVEEQRDKNYAYYEHELARLRVDRDDQLKSVRTFVRELRNAEAERDRYKAALEFYANPDNYDTIAAWGKIAIVEADVDLNSRPPFIGQRVGGKIARAALNLQPAQQEVRMSPQEKADVLEWALRRAVDWLQASGGSSHAAKCEVLKILADNGLTYDADGKLVERKAGEG